MGSKLAGARSLHESPPMQRCRARLLPARAPAGARSAHPGLGGLGLSRSAAATRSTKHSRGSQGSCSSRTSVSVLAARLDGWVASRARREQGVMEALERTRASYDGRFGQDAPWSCWELGGSSVTALECVDRQQVLRHTSARMR